MARGPRPRQPGGPYTPRQSAATTRASHLCATAILLLADAQDDAERFTALAIARLALREREKGRSGKYGLRGPYNQVKSEDFFEIILHHSSTRWFKSWLRYVSVVNIYGFYPPQASLHLEWTGKHFGIFMSSSRTTQSLSVQGRGHSVQLGINWLSSCVAWATRPLSRRPPSLRSLKVPCSFIPIVFAMRSEGYVINTSTGLRTRSASSFPMQWRSGGFQAALGQVMGRTFGWRGGRLRTDMPIGAERSFTE